jgi:hypothetical protein
MVNLRDFPSKTSSRSHRAQVFLLGQQVAKSHHKEKTTGLNMVNPDIFPSNFGDFGALFSQKSSECLNE